jgi:hypothetical protein
MAVLINILFYAIWLIFCPVMCYRQAKKKGLNVLLWAILGLMFGLFALAVVAFKKKSDSPRDQQTLKEQTIKSADSIQYAVNNLSRTAPFRFIKKLQEIFGYRR